MEQQKRVFLPISTRSRTPRIGIMGYTQVGRALESSFDRDQCDLFIVDDEYGLSVDNLMDFGPDLVFICYDIEVHESSGRQDASLVEDSFLKILRRTKAAIAVCSAVTPDIMERMCNTIDDPEDIARFIHWPAYAKPESFESDFKQPPYAVFGGSQESVNDLKHFINFYSDILLPQGILCNPIEAAYIKCVTNGFIAMKNAYVNELYDAVGKEFPGKITKHLIMKAFMSDPRIGTTGGRVNYPRGTFGETKKLLDTFLGFTSSFKLLDATKEVNDALLTPKEEEEEMSATAEEIENVNNE